MSVKRGKIICIAIASASLVFFFLSAIVFKVDMGLLGIIPCCITMAACSLSNILGAGKALIPEVLVIVFPL